MPVAIQYRPTPAVFRRRRLLVLLVIAGLVLALATMAARLGREPHVASEPTSQRIQLVSTETRVVQPGDTLWTIARRAHPVGDVRPLVQYLADRYGADLQVGDRIQVPSAKEIVVGQN